MSKVIVKLLILLVSTGVLPWFAAAIGQVGSRVAVYGHVAGIVAVVLMKIYDRYRSRPKGDDLDAEPTERVNGSGSSNVP